MADFLTYLAVCIVGLLMGMALSPLAVVIP